MFDSLIADLKLIIVAVKTPSAATVEAAVGAAADILTEGISLYMGLFGAKGACPCVDPVAECEAIVKAHEAGVKTAGLNWASILALIQMLIGLFTPKQPVPAA